MPQKDTPVGDGDVAASEMFWAEFTCLQAS
jgi:hypothetical protein